jgi:chemotaxis protein CheD
LKYIVAVADMQIANGEDDVIVTHALGSCLGVTIYDPVVRVGGMLHVMLPLSTIDPQKAADNPYMFVDTAVPRLFLEAYKWGAQKGRLEVRMAGGAAIRRNEQSPDFFEIGRRNVVMLRKLLWRNGVLLKAEDVGGGHSRTMSLALGTGEVRIRTEEGEATL